MPSPTKAAEFIGLKLPGLKRWRMRSGLTQQLADRVGARLQYISRVEQGKRGCNRAVAEKMAEVLGVSLQELGAGSDVSGTRYLHKAYLKVILKREVGSAYLVLDEREIR
jgi:transcriptional regulator with XRE-family HTH domain